MRWPGLQRWFFTAMCWCKPGVRAEKPLQRPFQVTILGFTAVFCSLGGLANTSCNLALPHLYARLFKVFVIRAPPGRFFPRLRLFSGARPPLQRCGAGAAPSGKERPAQIALASVAGRKPRAAGFAARPRARLTGALPPCVSGPGMALAVCVRLACAPPTAGAPENPRAFEGSWARACGGGRKRTRRGPSPRDSRTAHWAAAARLANRMEGRPSCQAVCIGRVRSCPAAIRWRASW